MCLASVFDWDVETEDAKHLSFLLAVGAALEKLSVEGGGRLASAAGVNMIRQYLKGAALQTLKQLFRKVGVGFTRKALEKSIPFGVGVALGSGANYVLTQYVGYTAIKWFELDREESTHDEDNKQGEHSPYESFSGSDGPTENPIIP